MNTVHSNPNRGYTSPPLVTHATELMPVTPAPRKPRVWPYAASTVVLSVTAGVLGTLLVIDLGYVTVPSQTSCVEMVEAADAMALASARVGEAAETVSEGGDADMNALKQEWNTAYDAYASARAECEVSR
jgi:hypothetical protein